MFFLKHPNPKPNLEATTQRKAQQSHRKATGAIFEKLGEVRFSNTVIKN